MSSSSYSSPSLHAWSRAIREGGGRDKRRCEGHAWGRLVCAREGRAALGKSHGEGVDIDAHNQLCPKEG